MQITNEGMKIQYSRVRLTSPTYDNTNSFLSTQQDYGEALYDKLAKIKWDLYENKVGWCN